MSSSEDRPGSHADIERRLSVARPLPRASFRDDLRRRLLAPRDPQQHARLRLLVVAYAGSGGLLLAMVALGIAGAGPFAA